MQTRTPQKNGVLGVLGVPKTLQANNGVAYSHGTPLVKGWNTWCSEHQWCSASGGGWLNTSERIEAAPAAGQTEHDAGPVPSCWPLLMSRTMEHKQTRARAVAPQTGAWGSYE
jgi:hypothetical protein